VKDAALAVAGIVVAAVAAVVGVVVAVDWFCVSLRLFIARRG